jgi:pimeloyl-ACP methyl ester carboxylesterase
MVNFATPAAPPATRLDRVTLSNGVTLHYAHQGPRTGPAVVLLHGTSDSWFSFSRVLPLLPAELRVVAPDHRGHGDSDRPAEGYGPGDFADDTERLMDALGIEQAVIVGHSMGSFIARKLLERAPHRVARLVLLGAGATGRVPAVLEVQRMAETLTDPVDEAFVREFQAGCIQALVPHAFFEAVVATSRRTPARVWRAAVKGMVDDAITLDRPPVRTLVLGGRQDAVFPPTEQMVLARRFPRGELHLVDGVGHSLHWERPEVFVSALLRFGV